MKPIRSLNQTLHSSLRLGAPLAVIITLALLFQNCDGFEPINEGYFDRASQGSPIVVLSAPSSFRAGQTFRLGIRSGFFSQEAAFEWLSELGNNLDFCEITSSTNQRQADFTCPEEGLLRVQVNAIFADGSWEPYFREFMIHAADAEIEDNPGGSGGEPPSLSGAELYQVHCQGCHSPLSRSQKRGTSLSALNAAITTNLGGMGTLSSLSAEQRQAIIDALR